MFDTYWYFAAKRQELFFNRVRGLQWESSNDSILANHRFTNAYRASDRVSQFLISDVIAASLASPPEDVFFRTLLFKFFNRIGTWQRLTAEVGTPSLKTYSRTRYCAVFDEMMQLGERVYSSAYIMPSPMLGQKRKHANHLLLLECMIDDGLPQILQNVETLAAAYRALLSYPSLGPFLAYQYAIDLNYGPLLNFSESEFVVAGPGAVDGIQKCFVSAEGLSHSDIITAMAEMAEREFDRLDLNFTQLWGRPLQLVDCQNLFCEVDKYARYAHPEAVGRSGRTRIKRRYQPDPTPLDPAYPAKWNLSRSVPNVPLPRAV